MDNSEWKAEGLKCCLSLNGCLVLPLSFAAADH